MCNFVKNFLSIRPQLYRNSNVARNRSAIVDLWQLFQKNESVVMIVQAVKKIMIEHFGPYPRNVDKGQIFSTNNDYFLQ